MYNYIESAGHVVSFGSTNIGMMSKDRENERRAENGKKGTDRESSSIKVSPKLEDQDAVRKFRMVNSMNVCTNGTRIGKNSSLALHLMIQS